MQDIFGALLNGARVSLRRARQRTRCPGPMDGPEEITVFHATPSLYRYLSRRWASSRGAGAFQAAPGSWEAKGGASDLERYKEHFEPGCLLVNGCGLSESTVSLQCFFDMAYENAGGSLPIGTAGGGDRGFAAQCPGRSRAGLWGDRPGQPLSGPGLLAASELTAGRLSS